MAKSENVQIPMELFMQLIRFHCIHDDLEIDKDLQVLHESISDSLKIKLDALVNRELYSRSKTAATPAEREKARQQYLEKRGIPQGFRW